MRSRGAQSVALVATGVALGLLFPTWIVICVVLVLLAIVGALRRA